MGSNQQYCLRWNNHQSNILSVFDSLFQNEAMVDVTLACEGLSIKAHKMVLSACSPYFQSLFMENPCKHPIVILKDVNFADLKALMDFMYRGEVNVNQEQLDSLLKTAETLKVRGLTEVATNAGDLQNSILNQEREATHLPPLHLAGIAPPQPSTHPTLVHTLNRSSPSPKRRKKMPDQQKANPSPSPSELEDSDNVIEPKIEIKESQQSNELMSKIIQAALVQTGSAAGGAFQSSLVHSDQAPSGAFQSNGSQGLTSNNDASPSVDQNFTVRPNEAVPQLLYKSSLCQPPGMQGDKVFVVRPLDGDHLTPEVDNTSSFKKQKGRPTILYEEEEDEIVDFIARNAYEGTPVDSKKILEYGNLLLRREGRRPTGNMYCDPVKGLSVKWWRGFKKRHPGLPYMRLK